MEPVLKLKSSITIFSLFVIALVNVYKNNPFVDDEIIRWKQLEWEDFQGLVKPFTGWAAGINSNIFMDYDSVKNEFNAYAGQNKRFSWKKQSSVSSEYLLKHEQYHFNITELHARTLNNAISNGVNEVKLFTMFDSLRRNMEEMQKLYDKESDHSLNMGIQSLWEYRVDSALTDLSVSEQFVHDLFSGGSVQLLSDVPFYSGLISDQYAYRAYRTKKYDFELSFTCFQYNHVLTTQELEYSIAELYNSDSIVYEKSEISENHFEFDATIVSIDSMTSLLNEDRWIYGDGYLFRISGKYPDSEDNSGYRKIFESISRSFEIKNPEQKMVVALDTLIHKLEIGIAENWTKAKGDSFDNCFIFKDDSKNSFYRMPFVSKN